MLKQSLWANRKKTQAPAFEDTSFTSAPAAGQAAKTWAQFGAAQLWVWVAVAYHTLAWYPE